jgi:hypothetical protein
MTITLAEINVTLGEMRDEQKETTEAVKSLTDKISAQMEASELARLSALNDKNKVRGSSGQAVPPTPGPSNNNQSPGLLGSPFAGLGAGMALAGGGMLKGAAGLTAMGLAIPAFFGGLLAGSEGLSWLQDVAGMDYDGLKKAALGFSDIILDMDPMAFTVLAGIMGISSVGGKKAAVGVGFMGLAISGFLAGLLAGSTALGVAEWMGADLNFGALKKTMAGFGEMILSLEKGPLIVLAGLLGTGAILGLASKNPLDAAKGMAGLAAGIIGFLGGLVIGNDILSFGKILGADLNLSALGKTLSGFSQAVGQLTPEAGIALAGIMGAAVGLAKFGADTKTAKDTVAMMTGLGAGISGLMIGLTVGDVAISWLDKIKAVNSAGLVGAFKMFNDSIGALNNENSLTALAAILGAGGAIGAVVGAINPAAAAGAGMGIFAIMTGIGAGIAGLMVGLATGDFITSHLQSIKGDGPGITGVFKTFNDSILAITPEAIERIKKLMELGGKNIAGALTGLSAGIVAFLGAEGLVGLTDKLSKAVFGTIDSIFGTSLNKDKPGIVEQMIEGLKPLDNFDISKIDEFSNAINGLSASFNNLSDIKIDNSTSNISKIVQDIAGVLDMWPNLINGGTWENKNSSKWFGLDDVYFGPGIKGIKEGDVQLVSDGINYIKNALNGTALIEAKPAAADGAAFQLDEIQVQAPRDVSIVKISQEVLNDLTVALMQSDYQERTAAVQPVNIVGGDTTNIGGDSTTFVQPMPPSIDLEDGGLASGQRRSGPF